MRDSAVVCKPPIEVSMRIALVSDAPIASLRRPLTQALKALDISPRYTVIEDARGDYGEAATHLHEIQPQVTLLYTEVERLVPDLFQVSTLTSPPALKRRICDAAVERLFDRIGSIRTGTGGTLLVTDLPIPSRSPLGIQDTAVELGLRACVERINRELARRLRRLPRVRIISFSNVVARIGEEAVDLSMWNLGGSRWTSGVFEGLAEECSRHLYAMLGRTRTVLVVEGDGVLWGGSAEERGATGIQLDQRDRSRQYVRVQEMCINLKRRGVQLALATRTSREDVLDALTQHPQMRLKPTDFDHMEMRWTDKASMIRNIAESLNVDTDKMVYVDANTSECSWIRSTLPEVEVLAFNTATELAGLLENHPTFESDRLFLEAEPPLTHLEPWTTSNKSAGIVEGIEGYLESLETSVTVGLASRFDLPRLLAHFNDEDCVELTGRELLPNPAEMASQNPRCQVWWVRMEDRFDESKLVGLLVFHRGEQVWTLQHYMLTTQGLARGVDSAVLGRLAEIAQKDQVDRIEIHCLRGANPAALPGSSFEAMGLKRSGFTRDGLSYALSLQESQGVKLWRPSYVQCKVEMGQANQEIAA